MDVCIDNEIKIYNIPIHVKGALQARLTIKNPQYQKNKAMGLPVWGVPRDIKLYSIKDNIFCIPRGFANELKNHPGLPDIVGRANQYSTFDMTDKAVNARALQSTLVKQSAVNALQAMRDASKTGGAVGAVSEKEWPILEQQLAALDGAQTTTAYKAALTNLNNQLTTSSKRVRNAYEQTYGQLKYESTPYEQQTPALGQPIPDGAVRRVR